MLNSQNLDWKGKITHHVCCGLVFDGIARYNGIRYVSLLVIGGARQGKLESIDRAQSMLLCSGRKSTRIRLSGIMMVVTCSILHQSCTLKQHIQCNDCKPQEKKIRSN
eukprot:1145431-Pelagomonas_calceolata.AAC.2